ncbi:MAG: hypothetical protein JOZ72_05435 [Alphaproteobacteria bacterium]|nr:hypothetical protein [Alphaproteobacteria bacterium]
MIETSGCFRALALACALLGFAASSAQARGGFSVLHVFGDADGHYPAGSLIADSQGNLYGTTQNGVGETGIGSIYEVAPDGTETVLFGFPGSRESGGFPQGRLLRLNGDLYGTTVAGGRTNFGVVFKLSADGTQTLLYQFCKKLKNGACPDGAYPKSGLVADDAGNLYGVTEYGGKYGAGVVFKLTQGGAFTVLHQFCSAPQCSDGAYPYAELMMGAAGNLYGTTGNGGGNFGNCPDTACGVAFRLATDGSFKVLYAFKGGSDGAFPQGALIQDQAGNLYGTAYGGGSAGCLGSGCGTVYRIAPDGTKTTLYVFKGGLDGAGPVGQLLLDDDGYLYGTTTGGAGSEPNGYGTVFRISPDGKQKVLHNFCINDGNCLHGVRPVAGLTLVNGMFYGTTNVGGPGGYGVVFQLPKK